MVKFIQGFSLSLLMLFFNLPEAQAFEKIRAGEYESNRRLPNLSLSKSASDFSPDAGTEITFFLSLTNNGDETALGVEVLDQLPSGFSYVSDNGQSTYTPGTGVWNVGSLEPNESASLEIVVLVRGSGNFVNQAAVIFVGTDADSNDNQASVTISPVPQADLSVVKSASSTNVPMGSTVTFTINLENNGPSPATGIEVEDLLPNGFEFISANPSQGDYNENTGLWEVGNLASGLSASLSIVALVLESDGSLDYENQVEITSADQQDPDPSNNSDSFTIIPIANPSWTLSKTVLTADFSNPEDELEYEFVLENTGNVSIENVQLVDNFLTSGPDLISGDDGDGVLEVGESWTYRGSYEVTQEDIDSGLFSNTATASGDPISGSLEDAEASEEVLADLNPAWTISKSSDVDNYSVVGEEITYEIILSNEGNVSILNVSVEDPLATTGPDLISGDDGNGILDVGETWIFEATYQVTQENIDAGSITNEVTATGDLQVGNLGAVSDTETDQATLNPDWTFEKTANPSDYQAVGEVITYTFTLENTGNVSISNVDIEDAQLAEDAVLISGDGNSDGKLNPGEIWVLEGSYTVTLQDLNNGSITNNATANGSIPAGTLPELSDEVTVNAIQNPSWTLTKVSNPNPASYDQVGDEIQYTIQVENTGNVSISDVSVSDPTATSAPTLQSGDSNSNGILDPGENWVFRATYRVTQEDIDNGSYTNTANASGVPAGGSLDDASDEFTVDGEQNPSWSISKTVQEGGFSTLGDELTYEIIISNTGNVSITDVVVSDPFATTGPTFVSGSINDDEVLEVGETWIFEATHVITQEDLDAGNFTNTVTANGSPAGGELNEVTDTESLDGSQNPQLTLSKTVDQSGYSAAGDVLDYTITITNTGNQTITDIVLTDPKAGIEEEVGTLAPGESFTLEVQYTVTQEDVDRGSLQNNATAVGSSPSGATVPSRDSETLNGAQTSNMEVTKTVDKSEFDTVGEELTYTVVVENTGNITINNLEVSDPLIAGGLTFVSGDLNENGVFDVGEIWTYTGIYVVTQEDIDSGGVENTATASGEPAAGSLPDESDSAESVAIQNPAWEMTKTATNSPKEYSQAGEIITYELEVTNTGNVSIENVDVFDPGATTPPVYVSGDLDNDQVLDPGETWVFEATYTVKQSDIDSGSFSNTATANGNSRGGLLPEIEATETVPAVQNPEWEITKTADKETYQQVGETVTYTFEIENTGNISITDPVVSDPLTSTPQFQSGDTNGNNVLDPGETWIYTATYQITQEDINAGSLTNSVTANGEVPDGLSLDEIEDTTTIDAIQITEISVDKSVDQATYDEDGIVLTFTIEIENTGNVDLDDVSINDEQIGLSESGLTLAPGEKLSYTGTITVTQEDVDNGSISNTANASATGPGGIPTEDEDTVVSTADQRPSISVDKSLAEIGFAEPGDELNYTITVTNTGNVTLTEVNVTDPLTGLDQTIPSLVPGESVTIEVTYEVTQEDINNGTVTNDVQATALDPNQQEVDDEDSVSIEGSDSDGLSILKTADVPGYAQEGDVITYTIVIANTGNKTLTDVEVTDPLTGLTETIPVLEPGESETFIVTYTITQEDVDNGSVENIATVSATDPDGNTIEREGNELINGAKDPSLRMDKSVSGGPIEEGQTLTYTIVISNDGNQTISDIEIVDDLDPNSPVTVGELAPGETFTYTFDYTVTAADEANGAVLNTAEVTGQSPDGEPVEDSDTANIGGGTNNRIEIEKDVQQFGYFTAGEVLNYTIRVRNRGSSDLTGIEVSDPKVGLNETIDLASGESETFTVSYTVTQEDLDVGFVENTATATVTAPDNELLNVSDTEIVNGVQTPRLEIGKQAGVNGYSRPGDVIPYTIIVANTGNITQFDVIVVDPLTGLDQNIGDLAPGDIVTLNETYTVEQNDLNVGFVENTATATGNDFYDNATQVSASDRVGASLNPRLEFTKSVSPTSFSTPDTDLNYTITVSNTGNITYFNLVVSDPRIELTSEPFDLDPGESRTFTGTYVTTQDDLDLGQVTNTATVTGEDFYENPINRTDSETVRANRNPEITVTKNADASSFTQPGDRINYTIVTSNTGNITIDNPVLNDPKVNDLTYIDGDDGDGVLQVGESWNYTASYTVTQEDIDAGEFANTATATGNARGGGPISGRGNETVNANQNPGWILTKRNTNLPKVYSQEGEILTYELRIENVGNVSIRNINLSDPKASQGPTFVSGDLDNDQELDVNETWIYSASYTVTQADLDRGSFSNTATVSGTPAGGSLPNLTATETVPAIQTPRWTVTKTSITNPNTYSRPGQKLNYNILVTNTGNISISDVTVSDPFVTKAPTYRTGDTDGDGILDIGESWTYAAEYTVTQEDIDAEEFVNTATASGTPAGGSLPDESDDEIVRASLNPRLEVNKTVNKSGFIAVGESLEYTIVVSNIGNMTLFDVEVLDPKTGLEATIPQLDPGESVTYNETYLVTQPDLDEGAIVNTATATSTTESGTPVNGEDTASINGAQNPKIDIEKAVAQSGFLNVGDELEYTITVTNSGNVTLFNVEVADPKLSFTTTIPEMAPGQVEVYSGSYFVQQIDIDNGQVINIATAGGNDLLGNEISDFAIQRVTGVQNPGISSFKSSPQSSYSFLGEVINYEIRINNTGNVTLYDVQIDDPKAEITSENPVPAIEPGETAVVTAIHVVTQADLDATTYSNQATALANLRVGDPLTTTTNRVTLNSVQNPSISIQKSSQTADYDEVGDILEYTMVVTNTGNVTLSDISVTDPFAAIISGNPVGTLAPGESATLTAEHVVTQADLDAGFYNNKSTAVGFSPLNVEVSAESETVSVPAIQSPLVEITKATSTNSYDEVGDIISYTFVVTNTGNVTLSEVTVTDPNAEITSGNPIASLAPGESATVTAQHVVELEDLNAGFYTNQAAVEGNDTNSQPINNQSNEVTVPAVQLPAFELEKTVLANSYTFEGEEISYRLTVTNTGNVTLTNILVSDPLTGTVDATLPDLDPGEEASITVTYSGVSLEDLDRGFIENTATATAEAPDSTVLEDSDEALIEAIQNPLIEIEKTADVSTYDAVNDEINYTIVVTNAGNVTLTNVVVTDPLTGLSETINSLEPGESETFVETILVTQQDLDNGAVDNTARTDALGPDGTPVSAVDNVLVPANRNGSIEITKTAAPISFNAPETVINYTLEVTNTGNLTLLDVEVTDPLTGFSTTIDQLDPGQSETFSTTYTTSQADLDAGGIINEATAKGFTTQNEEINDTDDARVVGSRSPGIEITKTSSPKFFNGLDDEITYELTVENTGNVTLTNVTVNDPRVEFTQVIPTLAPGQVVNLTATYSIKQVDVDNNRFVNVASVVGTTPEGNTVTDQDFAIVLVAGSPAIELEKTASPKVFDAANQEISYTLTATNIGEQTLTQVVIVDDLTGDESTPVTLGPGESTTLIVTYQTTQQDLDAGRIDNTATVTSLDPDNEEVSAEASAVVLGQQAPSISISKTAGQLVYQQVDEEISYEIIITNTGNVTLTDISFTDPLTGDENEIVAASLAPGESLTINRSYSITQEDIDRGFLVNTASVSGTDPNGVDTEDEDDARVISFRQSRISVSKTPLTRFYNAPGISMGYEIIVTNIGNTTLTDVEVTDPLTGLMAMIPVLEPEQSETFTTFYTTTQEDVDRGFVSNQANASGITPADRTVNDSDVALILARRDGSIQIEKEADRDQFTAAGEVITYTLIVSNTGNVTLNTVSVVDPLTRFDEVIPSLAPGESVSLTTSYTATQEDLDAGEINNTATASGLTPASRRVTDTDSERVIGQQNPGISVSKTASPLTYTAVDEVITYTLTVTNTGNVTLNLVNILDPLTNLDQNLGSLEVGESVRLTTSYTITQADVDAGEVTNLVSVTGISPKGNQVEDQDDARVVAIQNPGISIEKTSNVNSYIVVGDLITYTLLVTNTGNVTLTRVIVSDPLTELGTVIPELAPQESVTLTETYSITQADLDEGLVVNTASTSGIPPSGVRVSDQDSETVRAIFEPSIDLVKTATPTQYDSVGTIITYTLTVTNTGNVSLTDVRVRDPLTFLDRTVGTLQPNESASLTATYTITQEDLDAGLVTNRAQTRGVAPDNRQVVDEDQVTITALQTPAIQLIKNANVNSYDAAGDLITYQLEVTNTGNVSLENVTVEDPLTSTSEIVGTLAPGESAIVEATYTVKQADVDLGQIENTATATGEAPDGTEPTDEDSLTIEGVQNPDINLTKETGNLVYDTVGEEIAYTITVENTGNVTLTQVEVQDPLTGESITIPSLDPGEEVVLPTSYFITQEDLDGGSVLNTASVVALDPNGETVSDEDDITSVANQTLGLEVTKTPSPLIYTSAGTVITYQISVENIGNVTLSRVRTQDPQTELDQTASSLAPGEVIQYTATYTITQDDVDAGSFTNTVLVDGLGPNDEPVEDQDQATVFARQIAEIEITKTPDTRIFDEEGEVITYTIVVTNTGNVTLTEVDVTDPQTGLDETIPSLAPGDSQTFTTSYTLTQTDVNNESFRNTASVEGIDPNGEIVTDEDDARVFVRGAAAIELIKTPSPRLFNQAGEIITYTFTVVNIGNQTLTDIVLSDPKVNLSNEPLGTLDPGQSTTFTATYTATQEDMDAGFILNQATVSSLDPDNGSIEDTDFALVGGIRSEAIQLIKTPVQRVFDQDGDVIDYTLTVTNVGNVTLENIIVTDPLTEFTSDPLTLAPGESELLTTSYTVSQEDLNSGFVRNTASVVGTSPAGRQVESTDNALVLGRRSAAIQLDKTPLQRIYAAPEEEIFYELTITNTGNVTLTEVQVIDELTETNSTILSLDPGESETIPVSYTTTQEDVDRGFVLNTATVTGTTPASREVNDSDRAVIIANRQADIELLKENITQDYDEVGEILTYTLTVNNTGNVTLSEVRFLDPLTETDVILPIDLAPGESEELTVTYTVTQEDIDRGEVANQASVTATTPANRQVEDEDEALIPAIQNPSIDLEKSVVETEFDQAGDVLNYTLVVTNTGNVTLDDATLIDPLTELNEDLGTLAPGQSATITVSYTVTQEDVDAGFVSNFATASATDPSGVVTEDNDEVTVPGIQNPEIEVAKTALTNSYDEAGDVLNYEIVVTNTGNVTLDNVTVTDPLTGLAENIGTLAPGESFTINTAYTVNQQDVDTGLVSNRVDVVGQDPNQESVEDFDTAEVEGVKEPSISIEKEANVSSVDEAGAIITYTLTITNTGNVTLTDGVIEDPLTNFISTFESLAPGQVITRTTTYVVTLEDMDAGEIPNTATVEALDPDEGLVEDEDSELVEAIQLPVIEIMKTADVNSFDQAGQEITYTLTVTNLGNVTLTDVRVSDPLTSFEVGGNTLEPGESLTFETTYQVEQADVDAGFIANTATATGLDPNQDQVEDEDSLRIEALQVGSVDLRKTASPRIYRAEGDVITYTLTVTNTGNLTLTSLELTDPLTDLSESFGPLAPGESQTFTTSYTITQEDVDGTFVINDAQVEAITATDEIVSDQDQVRVFANGTPAIEITKTAEPIIYFRAGQVITYTLEVTNVGTLTLDNVQVVDPLTGLNQNLGTLSPETSRTLVTTYTVTQADVDNGSLSNVASVSGFSPSGDEVNDEDEAIVRALRLGRITIEKTPSPRLYRNAGDIITYTITIENTGNVTLTDIQLSDPLTDALVTTQALLPGERRTFTERYAVSQADVDAGFVLNIATVEALTPTGRQLEESDFAIVFALRSGDLVLSKEADVQTYDEVGDEIVYTLTATNTGNVTLTNLVFTDPLTDFEASIPTLAVSESQSVSFSYFISQEDLDRGFVPNTATVQAIIPANRTLTDEDSEMVTAIQNPEISIEKSTTTESFDEEGDVIEYSLTVTNTGNVTLTDVTITDPLTGLEENVGTLAPGESETITTTYTVTQEDVDRGSVVNLATATGTDPDGGETEGTDEIEVTGEKNPAIEIEKTTTTESFDQAGDVIEYSLTVTNTGNVTLTDVIITDPLTGLDQNIGTLAPGESETITTTYTVTQEDVDRGSVVNLATATGTDPDGGETEGTDEIEVTGEKNPAIEIEKTTTTQSFDEAGDVIEYTLTVTNTGKVTLTDVTITDPLTGLEENVGTLAPGESETITTTYTVTQEDVDRGSVINLATATGTDPDGGETEGTDEIEVTGEKNPAIEIEKTTTTQSFDEAGDIIEYSLTVTNTGNVTLTDVTITDPLTGLDQNIGTLAPGESETITTTYTVTQEDVDRGSVINLATATGTDPDGGETEGTDEIEVIGEKNPSIEIEKTTTTESFDEEGDVIEYSLTVTNTGNVTLTDVTITDPLTGLDQNIGTLAPGESETITTTYTVTQEDVDRGSVTNLATATGTDPDGGETGGSGSVVVEGEGNPSIDLTKTAGVETYTEVGQEIPYTLVVTNTGNETLTNVVVLDPLTGMVETIPSLEPGESESLETSYTVTAEDIEAGSITNNATVTATTPEGGTVEDEASTVITVGILPGLQIEKFVDKDEVIEVDEVITYTLVVTNTGNVALENVLVTDPLTGFEELIPVLEPEESLTFETTYTVSAEEFTNGDPIINVAFVLAENPSGGEDLTDQDDVITLIACDDETLVTGTIFRLGNRAPLPNVPVLLIPEDLESGETLLTLTDADGRYRFRDIPVGSYLIKVLDANLEVSLGLRAVDGDQKAIVVEPCVVEPADFRYTLANLGTGIGSEESILRGFVWYDLNGDGIQNEWYDANDDGKVTQNFITPGQAINVFNWEWIDLNGDGSYSGPENEGELNKAGFGNPDGVNIEIKGPNGYEATASVGQFGYWKHEIVLADPAGEYEVTLITDPVFDAIGLQLGASGLVKNLPDPSGRLVDSESSRRLVCEVTTPIVQFGTISQDNQVSFDFDYGLRCFLVDDEVNLAVEKTSFDIEIYEGDEFVYEVTLRNIGDTDATEVILIDDLPLNVSYLSSEIISNPSAAELTLTVSGNRLTWNIPEFTAGAELVVEIRVRAGDPGLITNIAEVSASENDIDEQNNRADDVNEILPFRIPNVITPGTIDGDNDTFEILGLGKFVSNEIVIFNRWGDHVFETEDYQNDWDAPGQVSGTYFYVLRTIDRDGRTHEFTGWIQVIKE